MRPTTIRHIRIESGAFTLDYQATAEQAQSVADELAAANSKSELVVTVDDDVQDDLPPLPCSELWE
ncbi:hypothetical protein AWN90_20745 [Nocardia terpenica]|uniref:Uncharacterized protein n=1 Tax=Nocardia terpenica TaxID=455432 RepID=A0A164PMD6_9NOCA|nr:hypothetical protein AWN90_20745 [Nocardia terpenica]